MAKAKARVSKKEYHVRAGHQISAGKVKKYGERIDYLIRKHGVTGVAKTIVADAERLRSPLHDFFEWDDTKAAHAFRLNEAGKLVRAIEVNIITPSGKKKRARAFETIVIQGRRDRITVTDDMYFSNEEYMDALVTQAYEEMGIYVERYKNYEGLKTFCKELQGLLRKHRKSSRVKIGKKGGAITKKRIVRKGKSKSSRNKKRRTKELVLA